MSKSFRTYPSIHLEEAISRVRGMYEQAGRGPSSKEAYVQGLGYTSISGASNRVFAALIHYGLVEKVGDAYKISDLGMRILYPEGEGKTTILPQLQQAALSPRLFKDVYNRYEGERLPALLQNTLIHDFRVYDKSAKEAALTLKRTLLYAELMNEADQMIIVVSDTTRDVDRVIQNDEKINYDAVLDPPNESKHDVLGGGGVGLKELPSGIKISFPTSFDFAVLVGAFSDEIMNLEKKAQSLIADQEKADAKGQEKTQ